jgi:hypothetical protein
LAVVSVVIPALVILIFAALPQSNSEQRTTGDDNY